MKLTRSIKNRRKRRAIKKRAKYRLKLALGTELALDERCGVLATSHNTGRLQILTCILPKDHAGLHSW